MAILDYEKGISMMINMPVFGGQGGRKFIDLWSWGIGLDVGPNIKSHPAN